jgi:hypothetical protein
MGESDIMFVKTRRYAMRLRKWTRYATGQSYQHVPQGVGRAFSPGQLRGYFNDLTGKAQWTGNTGRHGVPAVRTDTNPAYEFAIVVFQWGLGNWDSWLLGDAPHGRDRLFDAARWAVDTIDARGGWECWRDLQRPTISPYSAMAQGEGLSVLSRAASLDPDGPWLAAALRAYHFLMASGDAGLTRVFDGITALEEYPGAAFPSVLNGWAFALVGVVDLGIACGDPAIEATARDLAQSLARALPLYDTGYWSTYDIGRNIASPFYHDLHIAQLQALARIFPAQAPAFETMAARFDRYRRKRINRARAIAVKIAQKLGQAQVGEMA